MNKAVADDYEKVVDLNNNSDDLGKVVSISNVISEEEEEFFDAMEEQGPVSNVEEGNNLGLATSEEEEEFFDSVEEQEPLANFNVPLSIFHYKDYNSDFFTSWYNVSSRIFKEINQACPEKQALNLALSVLMFPYIVFTALGLVIYNKINSKTQADIGQDKTKKSETSVPERLAYGVLAAIVILVNIAVLAALLIPATLALATFYLLNKKLSHSLIAAIKISNGLCQNEHQNIEVSFREIDAGKSDIMWDMEVKFPSQFKQLLRDLYEDPKHNAVLKLSANIHLKNGLKPLRNEIKNVLATSTREFAKTMEELMKLEKKEITYDKLKELLNEFRVKVVSSIGPKLTTHLIYNAYQVAFIQAIKFAQKREEDFSLEDALEDILVKQELESQGKELPSEREIIIEDLEKLRAKSTNLSSMFKKGQIKTLKDLSDNEFPVLKAVWEQLKKEGKVAKREIIDIYKNVYPKETKKALDNAKEEIKHLKEGGQKRYTGIHDKLKEVREDIEKNSLTDGTLRRKLEDLFKFEYDDQEVERRLIDSKIKAIRVLLSKSDDRVKQSLTKECDKLEEVKTKIPSEVNGFTEKMYLETTKLKMQSLFDTQKEGIKSLCDLLKLLKQDESDLVRMIISCQEEIRKYLTQPAGLKEIIEKQNKNLDVEKNSKEKESLSIELIELCLKNNQEILKALKQLELGKKELLINEETKNDYKEELTSREKIKFAVIEDDLLKVFKLETFDEKEIKKLLERAELEYCLAEKRIKYPVIKTKDNIKHFSQNLLSPLIDNLTKNIINNIPGNSEGYIQKVKNWGKIVLGTIRMGASNVYKEATERKALEVAHNSYKEGETFLQHFESSYEKAGAFLSDLFSDEGETFKDDVWPKIEEHLHGMWDRFFKDIEFKLVKSRLDEASVRNANKHTVDERAI
ncbi:hypothetical protein [Wolbachia endosymbiont (group A) of Anomoia purmunda]|uniref:hypothetical protein n=1 Tax=Wolbachia endosymbiont (group A) of Anomoia purmunda TaxID=2953978 RepID=UPI0022315C28|nr:hypothetical protein [Wolbachia endosymbiont (group A) of Anomoia purmunda]